MIDRLCYPVPEAAEQLGIGTRTLWRMIRGRMIPVVKFGSRVLVSRAALEQFIEANLDTTGSPVREAPPHIRAKKVEACKEIRP